MKNDEVIEQPIEEKEDFSHVNPWVRFFARMFDYALFGFICFIFKKHLFSFYLLSKREYLIPLQFLAWIPLEALFLSVWGYTPGKFLLRTKVSDKWGNKLNFKRALRRSFSVWFRGIGMGLPVINIITMFFSFTKLKTNEITSWDKDEKVLVTHYPIQPIRLIIALVAVIFGFLVDFF